MSYSAIQNIPIIVNLLYVAVTMGWSVDGDTGIATHTTCNSGKITLTGYALVTGVTYQVSYSILSVSSGLVRLEAGDTIGTSRTTAGNFVETITVTGTNPVLVFYSDANCEVKAFNIRNTTNDTSNTQQNTLVYYTKGRKWAPYRTMTPDVGFSIDIDMVTMHYGLLYVHINGSSDRNNFYGVQYQSIIKGVEAKDPTTIKDYETLNYQANQLLISTIGGIVSSLGQTTTLIDTDFIKQKLESNGVTVISFDNDSVYSASFLNDEDEDVVNGSQLRGNYLIWELTTVDGSNPLKLFSVGVKSKRVFLGAR